MKIKVNKDGFVKLDQFRELLNVDKVVYYKITQLELPEGSFTIRFYDKKKRIVRPYEISKSS